MREREREIQINTNFEFTCHNILFEFTYILKVMNILVKKKLKIVQDFNWTRFKNKFLPISLQRGEQGN